LMRQAVDRLQMRAQRDAVDDLRLSGQHVQADVDAGRRAAPGEGVREARAGRRTHEGAVRSMNGTAVTRFGGDERNIGRSCANLSIESVHASAVCRRGPRVLSLLVRCYDPPAT